jgi:voltage-gated potassium channel
MIEKKRRNNFKSRLVSLIAPVDGPGSTKESIFFDLSIIFLILLSCSLVFIEYFYPATIPYLLPVEMVLTAVFILEYAARWYVSTNRFRYPFKWLSIVDLLAILPSFLLFAYDIFFIREMRTLRVFRLIRLLRLMRIIRLFRFSGLIYRGFLRIRVRITALTYRYRAGPLAMLFLFALGAWVLGANLLYLTESGLGASGSAFANYWDAYWHVIIVLMSGIEDKEPVSLLGRIEVTIMMLLGIIIIGYLTGEIVSLLVQKWQRSGLIALIPPKSKLKNHIVILGMNEHLNRVIGQIDAALDGTYFFLIVDEAADALPIISPQLKRRVFALVGDPREKAVLDQAHIDEAARIVVLARSKQPSESQQDIDNRSLIVTIAATLRKRVREIPTTVEILDRANLDYAKHLPGVDYVVGQRFGERLISQAVLHPGVTEVYHELFNFTDDSNEIYFIPPPKQLIGQTLQEARRFFLLYGKAPITLIGIQRPRQAGGLETKWCIEKKFFNHVFVGNETLMILAFKYPKLGKISRDLFDASLLLRH